MVVGGRGEGEGGVGGMGVEEGVEEGVEGRVRGRGAGAGVDGLGDGGLGEDFGAGEGAAAAFEGAEEGVAFVGEAGEAGREELEDAGVGEEVVEAALEVEVGVRGQAVGAGEGLLGEELAVEEAGFEGVIALFAPFEAGELADEEGLVGVAGLEAVEEGGVEGL
ncbi:MAG: hypothetical protein KatS3mg004_0016 [Bryobacteraceae bacterium]|nr:MAG: hypothetical protein KatS3mg004_0016 [Bryobacteraceae bacterium]